jgi:hypothetical protein
LLVASDGVTAVAADPDRDMVWWTDVHVAAPVVSSVALQAGDEPGRVAQDGAGLINVALRRGGAVVAIDLVAQKVVRRTPVCPAPRGIAYDSDANTTIVACASGELVTLASDGSVVRSLFLEPDLRDVVPLGGGFLAVSKLRTAAVLLIDGSGMVRSRTLPPLDGTHDADVAWRMVRIPGATGVAVAHQLASTAPINLSAPGSWSGGGSFGSSAFDVVTTAASFFQYDLTMPGAAPTLSSIGLGGSLPVDISIDASAGTLLVAFAGTESVDELPLTADAGVGRSRLAPGVTSVAYGANGRQVIFEREAAGFIPEFNGAAIVVPNAPSVDDTGFRLFHRVSRSDGLLACASCHPEGRDDGRVWQFNLGARRTKSLVGGVMDTAPFHWAGDLMDLPALMSEVYTNRMGGMSEDAQHVAALARFLEAIPRVPIAVPAPSASFTNGKALFESMDVGCTGCHSGPHLTTNAIVDVGTGQPFKVPTLIGVGLRAPYLHDGCAATLPDRFGACGGGIFHGHTSQLSASDIADLSLYVGSL